MEENRQAPQGAEDKKKTLEEAFAEMDGLIARMEKKDIPLEESFELYRRGMQLVEFCNSSIDRVEKQVIEIRGADSDELV